MERTRLALLLATALAAAPAPAPGFTLEETVVQFNPGPFYIWWSPTMELFGAEGPRASDVMQGYELNCHLLSALAAIAAHDPDQIRDMIRGRYKDGSYSVRFYALDPATGCSDGGCKWDAIPTHEVWINVMPTLDPELSSVVDSDSDGLAEIWVPLIEKAYMEYIARYWSSRDEYAYGFIALAALGWPATWDDTSGSISSLWRVLSAANEGFPVLAATLDPPRSGYVDYHQYTVLGTVLAGYTPFVALRNPWGMLEPAGNGRDDGVFLLSLWEFRALFEYVDFPDEFSASTLRLPSRSDALAFFEDVAGVPEPPTPNAGGGTVPPPSGGPSSQP